MGDCAGSDKRYSFRTSGTGNMLHVFECPIDLLSYLTLMHRETGRWIPDPMLSLGGVYEPNKDPAKRKVPVALKNMLDNHPEVTSISLHLDNDHAGKAAAWSIEGLLKDKYNVASEFLMPKHIEFGNDNFYWHLMEEAKKDEKKTKKKGRTPRIRRRKSDD